MLNTYCTYTCINQPGSLPGFLRGTKAHFKRRANGAPKISPRASNPAREPKEVGRHDNYSKQAVSFPNMLLACYCVYVKRLVSLSQNIDAVPKCFRVQQNGSDILEKDSWLRKIGNCSERVGNFFYPLVRVCHCQMCRSVTKLLKQSAKEFILLYTVLIKVNYEANEFEHSPYACPAALSALPSLVGAKLRYSWRNDIYFYAHMNRTDIMLMCSHFFSCPGLYTQL